jgi:hypothetical protein
MKLPWEYRDGMYQPSNARKFKAGIYQERPVLHGDFK